MEFHKPLIKAGLTSLFALSAITLYAASGLHTSNDDVQYINYLQSALDNRPFLKRHWSKGKAQPYLDRAQELASNGQRKEAIKTLEIYLESDESHYLTQWNLLKLSLDNATPRQSLAATQRFLKLLPEFGPVRLLRAQALQQMQRYREAAEDFRAALKDPVLNDRDRFEARQALYFINRSTRSEADSFAELKGLLSSYPKSVPVAREYALRLQARKQKQEAVAAWDRVSRISRDENIIAESQRAKATLLQELGQTDDALLALESLQSDNTPTSTNWNQKLRFAQAYNKKGKYAQALNYLTGPNQALLPASMVENTPHTISYQTYLRMVTDLSLKLNRHTLAIEAIQTLNQRSSSPEAKFRWLSMLGTLEQSDSHFEESLNYYQRALLLKDDLSLRLKAAEVAWHLQRFDTVSSLLQPAVNQLHKVKQPQRVRVRQRLCEALEKKGDYKSALECSNKLLKQHPKDQALLLKTANLAAKSGDEKQRLDYLKTAQSLTSPVRTGISTQDQRTQKNRQQHTLSWFRDAYKSEQSFPAGYAYASALLRTGQRDGAIIILSRLAGMQAPRKDKFKTYHALGYAMAANGDFVGAAKAWQKADKLHPTKVLKLRLSWALYGAGHIEQASDMLGAVTLEGLPASEQITWYELRGMIRFKQKQFNDSVTAREEVVRRAPTAKHWAQLAESYAAAGASFKADNAYEKAIAVSHGDKSNYVLQRAYLKIAEKKFKAAQILLDQALQEDPENPVIEEELGYAYARLGMNTQASEQFKQAINHYQSAAVSGRHGASKVMAKRNRLSRNVAALERGLKLSIYHSGNLKSIRLMNSHAALIAPYRLANGGAEVSYQPKGIGYKNGKQLQIFARSMWNSSKKSVVPSHDSSSVGVGVRYKPLAKHDAWVSVEHLSSTGENSSNNAMVRGTYEKTNGYDWPLDDNLEGTQARYYSDIYLDVAQLLQKDAPTLAYAEARAGRSWVLNDNWVAAPHTYLRGHGEFGDNDQHVVDAGVGISARLRGAYDFYEGYKADSEFYVRVGKDLDNSDADAALETRATVGLKLKY